VALLGSMILFIGHSLRTMTSSAIRSVPLDLQGPVGSYSKATTLAAAVGRQPAIGEAAATATAPFSGISHYGPAGATSAGQGSILAAPPGYTRQIKALRFLRGSLRPNQIVLDQQLAATLQARLGDQVTLRSGKGKPRSYTVSGIALVTAPDVLFQPLNPLLGPAPAQPPANVAILPLATFAKTVAAGLPAIPPGTAGSAAVPGAQQGIQWQVQAQVDPKALGGTPGQAFTRAGQIRNNLEATFAGRVQFVDNLSDSLNTATGDALYADALYIMLAVPGALLALGLAYLAALGTVEHDRRELALLRARRRPGVRRRLGPREGLDRPRSHPRSDHRRRLRAARHRRCRSGAAGHEPPRPARLGQRGAAQRPARAAASVAAALPRHSRSGPERADLLADREHRLLGGDQP